MPESHICLFESLQLSVAAPAENRPIEVRSKKLQKLLAFLLLHRNLHRNGPVGREQLGRALWPRADDATARRYVREYLYRARKLLAEFLPDWEMVTADEQFVYFALPPNCTVDVLAFEQLLRQSEAAGSLPETISLLQQAVKLYRGDLLANLYDDWICEERERLRGLLAHGLDRLSAALQAQGDIASAIRVARQLLELDPLEEATHRRLMALYHTGGDRARALQQYERCSQTLAEKLGVEPTSETQSLYRAMLHGTYRCVPSPAAVPSGPPTANDFTPFVGRHSELSRLSWALQESRSSHLQTVLILGDAGLGKTRLVTEWLAQLPTGSIVLHGRGHEFEQSIPYRPLLDALQQSLHRIPWDSLPRGIAYNWLAPLAQYLPDLYYHLPDLTSPAAPNGETGYQISEGLSQLLLSLAGQQQVILFLDDLHWADAATWQFLAFLARRAEQGRLLLVGTFSTSEASQDGRSRLRTLQRSRSSHTIALSPLGLADVAHMASKLFSRPPKEIMPLAQNLHQRCRGNPFFATELMHALLEADPPDPCNPAHLDRIGPPTSIQTFIENRLDRLESDALQTLSVAATIGRAFTFTLLLACTEQVEEALLSHVEVGVAQGWLLEQADGRYDFAHPQVREVIYRRLSIPRRQRFHYQIAAAVERETAGNLEHVLYHYRHSHRPAQAIAALLGASRHMQHNGSYGAAALPLLATPALSRQGSTSATVSSHAQQQEGSTPCPAQKK